MSNYFVFHLPNSTSNRCLDRFSILDDAVEDESGLVSAWELIQAILSSRSSTATASEATNVIDTILCSLKGSSGIAGDYGTLKSAIEDAGPTFFEQTWPTIVKLALRLPECFPDGTIKPLQPGDELKLSRAQAGCLVAHQFLGTLQEPEWRDGFYDFTIWYDSEQRHPLAAKMYLAAVFAYFEQFEQHISQDATTVDFSLHSPQTAPRMPSDWSKVPLSPAQVVPVDAYSTEYLELSSQTDRGAVVIAANKDVGFGQSATQEEMHTGNCPEACIEVLFTPPLAADQVLIIAGASPMLRISGHRRNISWTRLSDAEARGGRMLVMDALELDEASSDDQGGLPDLEHDNMMREITKAYVAFSSWTAGTDTVSSVEVNRDVIWTGLWGCGAFNGNPAVKTALLWLAASLAGKSLNVILDKAENQRLGSDLARLFAELPNAVSTSINIGSSCNISSSSSIGSEDDRQSGGSLAARGLFGRLSLVPPTCRTASDVTEFILASGTGTGSGS